MRCWKNFNSRPSARGDARKSSALRRTKHFNSRPSARGDRLDSVASTDENPFQFTPLREGRQRNRQHRPRRPCISIHAPPRGATWMTRSGWRQMRFQFTPLREGRPTSRLIRYSFGLFQFTPLREGRPAECLCYNSVQKDFNSRPSARGDAPASQFPRCRPHFNSRPSARGDMLCS